MNSRKDQIFLGIAVILIGAFVLTSGSFRFQSSAALFIVAGLGFLLMYKTKRKAWALVLGCYFACYGGALSFTETFSGLDTQDRMPDIFSGSLFFAATGIILMILFYDKNRRGLLIPGVLLIGSAIRGGVSNIFTLSGGFPTLIIFAACFYMIYLCGRYFLGRWPKYVSIALLLASVIDLIS